jgi:glycosyltransferase involved in cell wall biosynthesis
MSVTFSVLIPSRNGGAFLPHVLESALGQAGDFEVVVSDNANTDETARVLSFYANDQRLVVVRSDEVLSVTDNWMRALRAARGQYLLMIGDDDLLLPGFFDQAGAILARHANPDCLTFNAYSYVAPGSFEPDAPAYWSPRHFDLQKLRPERELARDERVGIVKSMFRFDVRFPLNMQLTLFSRGAVVAVPGDFFRAPFPDHFALNSMLLRAKRVVVSDERLLVVGVSPKSFGHYFYSGRQREGARYLGAEAAFPGLIEGSELVNSMHAWLIELRRTYPELSNVPIARWQYVARQVNHWYRQTEFGALGPATLVERARSLKPWEVATVMLPMIGYRVVRRFRGQIRGTKWSYISDSWPALRPTPHRTIADFAAGLRLR